MKKNEKMYKQCILLSLFFQLCFSSGVTIDMVCVIPKEGIVHSVRHAGQDISGSLTWTDDGLMPNDLGDYPIDIQFEANVAANLRVSIDGTDYVNGSAVKFQIDNDENEIVVPFNIEMLSDKKDVQINLSYFLSSQLGLNYSGDYTAMLSLKIET